MKVSYILPCYNSSRTLPGVVEEIEWKMEKMAGYKFEIILINDDSSDFTFDVIQKMCEEKDNVIGINLAKNFGQHSALMAGFQYASGDIVVCMDDDGQTPAAEVDRLIQKLEEGYDVVYAQYDRKKHSLLRNMGSYLNMKMAESMLGKPKELYLSSYFAAKKYVIEEVKQYKNPYPYVMGLVLRSTNNICNVKVTHRERMKGKSGYSLKKLVSLWVNGFTSFSVKPLRFATLSGTVTALVGFVYALWTIIRKLTEPMVPVGWSSTVAIILMIGGMILFVLGMIGEYIGRIYICINISPQYVIKSEITH